MKISTRGLKIKQSQKGQNLIISGNLCRIGMKVTNHFKKDSENLCTAYIPYPIFSISMYIVSNSIHHYYRGNFSYKCMFMGTNRLMRRNNVAGMRHQGGG